MIRNLQQPRPSRPLSRPARLVLIVLTAWALAMIVPSLIQVVGSLDAFGLSTDNDGVVTDVVSPFEHANQSPAAQAGLIPGDRIDLQQARCIPPTGEACGSLITVLGGLSGLQYTLPDHEITLPIVQANGQRLRVVHLHAQRVPLHWPARVVLLADTIVGVLFVLTAFRLVWTRPDPMTWGFFLYAIWFNPGQTYAYYAILQLWPLATVVEELAECFLRAASYTGVIVFALRFPAEAEQTHWRFLNRSLPVLWVVLASMGLASTANLFGLETETITRVDLLTGFAVDALVVVILLVRRRALPPQDEQRMRWVIAGFTIGMPAFILAAICQSSTLLDYVLGTSPSQVVVGLLFLLNGVLAYFVGAAVQRRRVVSVAIPLRHGTIVALLTLALSIPVFWLHEVLGQYQEHFELPNWIWPFVVGPLAVVLLQRLHEIAVDLMDRAFNRRFHEAKHRLHSAGDAMLEAGSFAEVDRLLTQEPVQALRLSSGAVFRRIDGTYRRMEQALGWEDSTLDALRPGSDQLALHSVEISAPVRLPRGTWGQQDFPQEEQAPCIAVPVFGGAKEAVAIALFGPHASGSDINADERPMLQDLASRAAIAYDRVETETLRQEVSRLRSQLAAFPAPLVEGTS